MNFLLRYKLTIIGVFIGGISGYLYYHFIGCSGDTCAITSNPLISSIYGAIMGGLLLSTFQEKKSI